MTNCRAFALLAIESFRASAQLPSWTKKSQLITGSSELPWSPAICVPLCWLSSLPPKRRSEIPSAVFRTPSLASMQSAQRFYAVQSTTIAIYKPRTIRTMTIRNQISSDFMLQHLFGTARLRNLISSQSVNAGARNLSFPWTNPSGVRS